MQSTRPSVQVAKQNPVWVYIWPANPLRGVGHTSIEVGGDNPTYLSIHPRNFPAFAPIGFIPLRATLAKSLKQDQQTEASYAPFHDDTVPTITRVDGTEKVPPAIIYQLNGLNTKAMQDEMKKLQHDGKLCYQQFPRINTIGFFNRIEPKTAAVIMENPFSGQSNDHIHRELQHAVKDDYKRYNCTSLVSHLLETGGAKIATKPAFWRPWGITPNGLSDPLKKLGAEEVDINKNKI